MPRSLPVRPHVIIGNIFVVLVSWVIGLIYYAYTFLVWLPKAEGKSLEPTKRIILCHYEFLLTTIFLVCLRRLPRTHTPGLLPLDILHAHLVIHPVYDH